MTDRYKKNLPVNRPFVAVNQFHRSQVLPHRASLRHDLHWPFARFRRFILRLGWRDRATTLSLCPPGPGRLSFREICRPRPQPIRSSAAPVKFTSRVYTRQRSCVTRRRGLLFLLVPRGREERIGGSQVSRCIETGNATKRKERQLRDERFELRSGRRESRKIDSERIHARKFVKGPSY